MLEKFRAELASVASTDANGATEYAWCVALTQISNKKPRSAGSAAEVSRFEFVNSRYAENELPQPQLFTAFGFSKVKPRFSRPS
jgi:hypothetical protein